MKRFALAGVAMVGGLGVAIACGDPYEGEIPNTEVPARDSGPASDDAASDAPVALVDAAPDAAPDVDPCSDRDKDGFVDKQCEGGTDCDDDDKRAFPDAGFVAESPKAPGQGDWNCDGTVLKQYPVNVNCGNLNGANCNGTEGFENDPSCGTAGSYVFCKLDLAIVCVVDTAKSGKRNQGCK